MTNDERPTTSDAKPPTIVIAAGGTGGHIMPAISVGRALWEIAPGCHVRFFCGARPQERDWYRAAGIEPVVFPLGSMGRGLAGKARTWAALAQSLFLSLRRLGEFEAAAVLGMGGYISAPACVAARLRGKPFLIHEQNAILGRTNRKLAPWARLVAGGYREIEGQAPAGRFVWTGNPVRETIGALEREQGCRALGLDPRRPVVAITGGSQGAQSLNAFVGKALRAMDGREGAAEAQVLWACGRRRYAECVSEFPPESFKRLRVVMEPFVTRMDCFWAAASVAIARAGASTIAEAALCGAPAVYFPLATAMDDHQRKNAESMERSGAAKVMSERDDAPEELARVLVELIEDSAKLSEMGRKARALAKPEAARDMAKLIWDSALPKS